MATSKDKKAKKRGRPDKRRELWLSKDPFLRELQDACRVSYSSAELKRAERERQLEDSFFRAAVALENFLGDWFARCMHFDTSRVAARARDEVEKHLSEDLAGGWRPEQGILARTVDHYTPHVEVTITVPKTVGVATARALLGTETRNRSWRSSADFKEQVGRYIAHDPARQATKTLDASDDALLDATLALRNVVAHRSKQAEADLQKALKAADLHKDLRVQKITVSQIGRYLQTERSKQPRYRRYYEGLAGVANKLAPYEGKPRKIWPGG